MQTVEVMTDAGSAFIKTMGNPEGLHQLACDWVGTSLARWMGLETFDFAIVPIDDWNEIFFADGGRAKSGPAFATKAEQGHTWGGDVDELKKLENPLDLTRLIIFDTWVRNCDRYCRRSGEMRCNYDNVFFRTFRGHHTLIAMDHSHSFTCGHAITNRIAYIDNIQDNTVYGNFPQYAESFDIMEAAECLQQMATIDRNVIERCVQSVPREWDISDSARRAWVDYLVRRADFLKHRDPWDFRPDTSGPAA